MVKFHIIRHGEDVHMQNPFTKAIPLVSGEPGDLSVVNVYTDFFEEFTADAPREETNVILKINADSEFAVWINGRFALTGQHSQFPDTPCAEFADITELIREGANTIAVTVYRQGLTTSTYISGPGQFLYEIALLSPDGEEVIAASSENTLRRFSPSYKSGPVPQVSGQLGFSFAYTHSPGCDDFLGASYTEEVAREDGFTNAVVLRDFEPADFTTRNIKNLGILSAGTSELVAQGLFDYGLEYRETNSMPHGSYMQNAALRSRYLHQLLDDPVTTREIPAVQNYALEPSAELPEVKNPIRLVTKELTLTGALREGRGIYAVIDIGAETLGYLSFRVTTKRPTVIGVAYSDHLIDLRARSYVGGRHFAETVIVPAGETAHTHLLSKIGARYIMLYAETDDITISGVGIIPTVYPVDGYARGDFAVNDDLHKKIYSTCLSTLLLCMNEHYMDCPQREQALYAMDSRNQMLCGYYAFGEYAYAKESLSLLSRSLRPDGLLELCAPAKVPITIPSFSLHWVIALCEYTKFSGDTAFFYEQLKTANTIMSSILTCRGENGALLRRTEKEYWNFHEWNGELSGSIGSPSTSDADGCLTALFIIATDKLAEIIEETGGEDESAASQVRKLRALSTSMRAVFNDTFFDPENEVYCSYKDMSAETNGLRNHSEYMNALAILSGAASLDENCLAAAVKAITRKAEKVEISPCTLSTCLFKYDALMSVSREYIDFVMEEITELWGYMISRGATSFWETIKGAEDFDDAGSLCHGWAAIPVAVYYRYILGIEPLKCGFEKYSVSPAFWDRHHAKGSIFLPAKSMKLEVTVDDKSFFFDEKVPAEGSAALSYRGAAQGNR